MLPYVFCLAATQRVAQASVPSRDCSNELPILSAAVSSFLVFYSYVVSWRILPFSRIAFPNPSINFSPSVVSFHSSYLNLVVTHLVGQCYPISSGCSIYRPIFPCTGCHLPVFLLARWFLPFIAFLTSRVLYCLALFWSKIFPSFHFNCADHHCVTRCIVSAAVSISLFLY